MKKHWWHLCAKRKTSAKIVFGAVPNDWPKLVAAKPKWEWILSSRSVEGNLLGCWQFVVLTLTMPIWLNQPSFSWTTDGSKSGRQAQIGRREQQQREEGEIGRSQGESSAGQGRIQKAQINSHPWNQGHFFGWYISYQHDAFACLFRFGYFFNVTVGL